MLDAFFFYSFAILTLGGALGAVTFRNPVHCAAALIASLSGVAGVFLLQGAEFLSVTQIIVYVGGVMLLFLFVIMLMNVRETSKQPRFTRSAPLATGIAVGLGSMLLYVLGSGPLHLSPKLTHTAAITGNTEQIGNALFTTDLLPFEIASVLLLAALIGSVVLARKRV